MQFSAVEFYVTVRCAFPSERNSLCVLNLCCKSLNLFCAAINFIVLSVKNSKRFFFPSDFNIPLLPLLQYIEELISQNGRTLEISMHIDCMWSDWMRENFCKDFSPRGIYLSCSTYVSRKFCSIMRNSKKPIVNYNTTLKKSSKNRVENAAILKRRRRI